MQDAIAGHIHLGFEQALNALPHVRANKLRAYAVTAKSRLASAPDIPTTDEAGLPGFYMSIWHAFWVPKGTPEAVVAKLNAAVVAALSADEVRQRMTEQGHEIPAPEQRSPQTLAAYHKAEAAKWWPIIKAANLQPQ